jgi:hypothetical protein
MKRGWLCSLVLLGCPAFACNCPPAVPVCNAVAYSNVVFIGAVESIAPMFLSDYNLSRRPELQQLNQANERYLAAPSPQNLAALKGVFRQAFPDLQDDQRERLDKASSQKSLVDLFYAVLGHEKRVRFRVSTVFRNGDDGDDDDDRKPTGKGKTKTAPAPAKKDDDDFKDKAVDVWTPFGDCGYDFQIGETYLVYADSDEDTNVVETDHCMRTRRVSDAGADLAYLFFYKERKEASGRAEGFTTFDSLYAAKPHDADKIASPAAGFTVELKSANGARYTRSDDSGKFLFDGLEPGDYLLSGLAPGFPDVVKLLAGPKPFHIDAQGCSSQVLTIPREPQPVQ